MTEKLNLLREICPFAFVCQGANTYFDRRRVEEMLIICNPPFARLTFSMPGSSSMKRLLATKQRLLAGLHEAERKLFPPVSLQFPEDWHWNCLSLRRLPDFPELPSIPGSWSWILYHPLSLMCLAFNTGEHLIICHEVIGSVWLTALVFVFVFSALLLVKIWDINQR